MVQIIIFRILYYKGFTWQKTLSSFLKDFFHKNSLIATCFTLAKVKLFKQFYQGFCLGCKFWMQLLLLKIKVMWPNDFFLSSDYYDNMSTKRLVFSENNTLVIQLISQWCTVKIFNTWLLHEDWLYALA